MSHSRQIVRRFAALALLVLIFALSQRAHAGTILAQAPVAGDTAFVSDFSFGQQEADNLSLGAPATVQSAKWWGAYVANIAPVAADFRVRFFADVAGAPAVNPFYDELITGITPVDSGLLSFGDLTIYHFSANLPLGPALAAGTTYYLSVVENNAGTGFGWQVDGAGPHWVRNSDGQAWGAGAPANFAFELYDTPLGGSPPLVPTPTAAAGGIALLGMLIGKRRRQGSF